MKREELKDLFNVIVFSSKGERPDQDKMGTGDLDGDIYWISWNDFFVQQFQEYPPEEKDSNPEGVIVVPPMRAKYKEDEEITRDDCIDNIVDFIKNDVLGQVANLHSKIADSSITAIKDNL